jgi:anti-anti-sigma factor
MEITERVHGDHVELCLEGRLDAAWAGHVGAAIEAAVRSGTHRIAVNCAALEYISSLGLAVLLEHYKRLHAVKGTLTVVDPSRPVLAVIKTAGLSDLLVRVSAAVASRPAEPIRRIENEQATFEIYAHGNAPPVECRLIGTPERLASGTLDAAGCRAMEFADGSIGVGLGAFGGGFDDCRDRFGEFLAAGGVAVTLPPAEHGVPDFVVTQAAHVPRVEVLYGLAATGPPRYMLRFDATPGGRGVLPFSRLIESVIGALHAHDAAFVVLAETAGVVGASIRRSPALAGGVSPLVFPGVRDWLTFTTERSTDRQLALIVGFAAAKAPPEGAPFLRSLAPDSPIEGHFHAAVFPYRPIPRGELPLGPTVASMVSASAPLDVMHVMADTREFEGVGQTDLMRGACWVAPILRFARA